jgi:hypothetical protein
VECVAYLIYLYFLLNDEQWMHMTDWNRHSEVKGREKVKKRPFIFAESGHN